MLLLKMLNLFPDVCFPAEWVAHNEILNTSMDVMILYLDRWLITAVPSNFQCSVGWFHGASILCENGIGISDVRSVAEAGG